MQWGYWATAWWLCQCSSVYLSNANTAQVTGSSRRGWRQQSRASLTSMRWTTNRWTVADSAILDKKQLRDHSVQNLAVAFNLWRKHSVEPDSTAHIGCGRQCFLWPLQAWQVAGCAALCQIQRGCSKEIRMASSSFASWLNSKPYAKRTRQPRQCLWHWRVCGQISHHEWMFENNRMLW